MCNNVFAFGPDGKIFSACMNYPGTILLLCNLWQINLLNLSGTMLFVFIKDFFDKFVGPMSQAARRKIAPLLIDALKRKHAVYISHRQASEWGIRGLQGSFRRLNGRLTSDKVKRGQLIYSIVLLHNFRTRIVGLNHVQAVFYRSDDPYINIVGYDRIARYFGGFADIEN
jgi:hypothetical protein